MIIQHNMTAFNSNRQLGITTGIHAKSSEKLSSGYKINRAADDAAGLAISEKMRRQIRGLDQGINNIQDGVSMCQIGDGALEEVMEMMHRMTELSVKAANDTLTYEDRDHIQQEIRALLTEIERIDDVTEFNNIKIFGKGDIPITNPDGTPFIEGDIPFEDFSFADVSINTNSVFAGGNNANTLRLQAKVKDPNSPAAGKDYNLIYGSGSTTNASVRVSYEQDGETKQVVADFANAFTISDYTNENGTESRKLNYDKDGIKFTITQKAVPDAENKKYKLSYSIENKCDTPLNFEYMFHADTAYNNKDRLETYYTGGSRMGTTRVYKNPSYMTNLTGSNVINSVPSSFAIVNSEEALAFSEKISFSGTRPDMLSVGQYSSIRGWDYYKNTGSLGQNTEGMDLGFSAVWQKQNVSNGQKLEVSFDYGISETMTDTDLKRDEIIKANGQAMINKDAKEFWIQASSEVNDGMYISFGQIDLDTLNLRNLSVTSSDNARNSLLRLKNAQGDVSKLRSHIGAQQNRLEHTAKNQANNMENTSAAESRIRDTDMAAEMVRYSNNNILMQAGQSMLAQANQTNQGVLSLLQ